MFKKLGKILTLIALTGGLVLAQQTTKDGMDGNWAVINGKKIFLSGMNIAWITSNSFGNDVGDTKINIAAFTNHIKNIRKAGGNAVRWWLHTDASRCPKIDATGAVTGLGTQTISNMRQALDTAYAYGVTVSMCLFSFDMLVPGDGDGKAAYSDYSLANNKLFLTVPENIDTYLENALKPILDSVGSHPAVMAWEVFNEPEGMLASANWSHVIEKLTMNDILRITNKIAGFVHRNSNKMASTGIASFQYLPEYSDASLIAAGGDTDGYLDFYMAHYYPEWQDASISPFENPASHWNADRPILIGEFPAKSWSASTTGPSSGQPLKTTKTINDAFAYAYDNGYAGALSWAMSEQEAAFFGNYETTAPALTALYNAHQADIMIKDVTIEEMSGEYAMQLQLANLAPPSGNDGYWELGASLSQNFTGKTNLVFDMYVAPGSSTNLQIVPVIKVTSAYTWSPAEDKAIQLAGVQQGKWITYEIPISAFGASDVSDVKEMLFQYWALTGSYESGTVYFDNIRVDTEVLASFDEEGSAWFTGANEASVSLVKRSNIVDMGIAKKLKASSLEAQVFAEGKVLKVNAKSPIDFKITLFDVNGKNILEKNHKAKGMGLCSFDLSNLASGNYILELQSKEGMLKKSLHIR